MKKQKTTRVMRTQPKLTDGSYLGSRIFGGDQYHGTYIVYGGNKDGFSPFACDVQMNTLEESNDKDLRAYRLNRKRARKVVPKLRKDTLHDELMVVFGSELSPADAVRALYRLVQLIESYGLLIGRDKNEDFLVEDLNGAISG